MQVAAEHPEAVRESTRIGMEERLLFHRVALDAGDVSPRHAQPAAVVEAHLAHAEGAGRDRTLMPARMAPQAIPIERLDQFGRRVARAVAQQFLQGRHLYSSYDAGDDAAGPICSPENSPSGLVPWLDQPVH